MTRTGVAPVDRPTQHASRILAILSAPLLVCLFAFAEDSGVVARAAGVFGHVLVSTGNSMQSFALTRGYALNPGDRVDTRGGGRLTIELSDGSMILVQPETVLVLKDFQAASSLRELFEITLGRVRVKINHFAGKPNPYRMNSPTASIAVRGTEFSIEVSPQGETEVVVYEGAVEVTSLSDPDRKVLLEAGRGLVIALGQDFRLMNIAARRDGAERAEMGERPPDAGRHEAENHPPPVHNDVHPMSAPPGSPPGLAPGGPSPMDSDHDESSPRGLASTYDRYIASLSQIGEIPFLYRYNAFAESHLDSLENPAYATGFHQTEGRLFVLPTLSGVRGLQENATAFGPAGSLPADYGIAPQFTIFTPVLDGRAVVGGSLTASRVGSATLSASPDLDPGALGHFADAGPLSTSSTSTSSFYSGSVIAAGRFGADRRSSLGVEFERLNGTGSLQSLTMLPEPAATSFDQIESRTRISQTRVTLGFSREFGKDQKLGVFYRYGLINANDGETSHLTKGVAQGLNATHSAGHSSEFGMRLRGSITPRLFYGVAGAWLGLSLHDDLTRITTAPSNQRDQTHRGSFAGGIGFLWTSRTVLSVDLAGGTSDIGSVRKDNAMGSVVQTGSSESHFVSAHFAIQQDFSRRLFATASFLAVHQNYSYGAQLYPDQMGRLVPVDSTFFPLSASAYQQGSKFSDFGIGWRFSRDFFAQYVFSTDYGFSSPSHMLMLRYTFRLKPE